MHDLRSWVSAIVTLAVLGVTVAVVELAPWPRTDFPPFVMTIDEWNSARIGYSDGTTKPGTYVYRLEYRRKNDWTLTMVGDDLSPQADGYGWDCRDGVFRTFDANGKLTIRSYEPAMCDGSGRWIHYGIATSLLWPKETADGRVTYTLTGERLVVDVQTGLPLLYEAGVPVGTRTTFHLERWGK